MRPTRRPAPRTRFQRALMAWRRHLGAAHVLQDDADLSRAETATFATHQRVRAILRPGSRQEVQACLAVAARYQVPLWPISRGRNWGYGSRVPGADGCVLLELARLDRIVQYDERLALLTIEPGVTFAQVHHFLAEKGSSLFLASIGGPPDASVLANALERGDGTGPNGDVFAHVCNFEVLLATGERLRTGPGRFPDARAAGAFRWGVGPILDGLFSQSNFGVVTELTVWLAPRAPGFLELYACVRDESGLGPLVDAVRGLILEGTLRGTASIWNDLKAFSKVRQYPFAQTQGITPFPPEVLDQFRQEFAGGRWNLSAAVYAPDEEISRAIRRRIERNLAPYTQKLLFSDQVSQSSRAHGVPSSENLRMLYWRKRSPMPLHDPDPHRDACGFIWLSVAVPFDSEEVMPATELIRAVLARFEFEENVALIALSPRHLLCVVLVAYDRQVPGEDARAMECHDALMAGLCKRGLYPSRLGIQAPHPASASDDSEEILMRIKRALDPKGILAPGRYGLR